MNRSEQINELAVALAKAQGAMESAKKDSENPHFRSTYASLASVWDACRAPLSQNGLSITQLPDDAERGICIETILMHTSGQWISSKFNMPLSKIDAHGIGTAISYARRYALCAMVGIAAEDDDGNTATGTPEKPLKEKTPGQIKGPFSHGITKEQHDRELAEKEAPKGQVDLGSFEDKIKYVKVAWKGKTAAGADSTLYEIETEGHGTLKSFSSTVFEDAETAWKGGHIVTIHSEPTPKGPRLVGIEWATAQQTPNPKSKAA